MSDPTPPPADSTNPPAAPDVPPTEAAAAPADAQPTEVYPPADAQPTAAYPPADGQPTEAYPPAYGQPAAYEQPASYTQPEAGQPTYGQPGVPSAYDAQPYGQPAYAGGGASATADRPRTLGWVSLGLAIGGLVLVGAAFVPLAWLSLGLAMFGGLLLLVALVLGIVTLASRKQGGKGLGISAIAVSVLGGLAWIGAITLAFVWIGVAAVGTTTGGVLEPAPSVSESAAGEEGIDDGAETSGTYDEAAYLAVVRPEILAIMQEIEPSITEEITAQFYTDEMLVSIGESLLSLGEAETEAAISGIVEGSQGMFSEEQATRFFTTIQDAAQQYLVE
jgi:hypothetical protein